MKDLLIASDHAGFALKEKLRDYLGGKGVNVKDLGTYSRDRCDYPEYAAKLAGTISRGEAGRGILICKSGIGNSIVANKFPGVRAALCHNLKSARLSRQHNDSNVLVMGSAFVKAELAKKMAGLWLKTEFLGGRHLKRVKLINGIENQIRRCVK
ncbi:MAG: ribose 5-phosphate isomerase B [Candidatus Omnitrophota bacterium]